MARIFIAALAVCLSATACRTVNVQPDNASKLYEKIDTVEKESIELVSVSEELPPSPQSEIVKAAVKKHVETVKALVAVTEEAKKETAEIVLRNEELKEDNIVLEHEVRRLSRFKLAVLFLCALCLVFFFLRLKVSGIFSSLYSRFGGRTPRT
ncbi:MAG TPA: hypothetical protein P5522_08600 [Spirochaetia bacterium]|nr:hypothetical protein [Spirochaetia bacterium]